MQRRSTSGAVAALFACAATVVAQGAVVESLGRHFRVELHRAALPDELAARLASEALAALEGAWPTIERMVQPGAGPPRTIALHAARASFGAGSAKCARAPVPLEFGCSADGSEVHVLLWPQWSRRVLEKAGLPPTTRQNLVVAATSAIVHAQLRGKPDPWLAQVVALAVLETTVNPKRVYGIDAAYDSRRYYAETAVRGPSVHSLLAMLDEDDPVRTEAEWDVRWSSRALVGEQLTRADAQWPKRLLAKWRVHRGPNVGPAARRDYVAAVLGGDWEKAQAKFAKTSEAMRPLWQQSAPDMWRDGDAWLLAGTTDLNTNVYAVPPVPAGDYAIAGTLAIELFEEISPFRFLVDWNGATMLGLHFKPPHVTIDEWALGSQKWTNLRQADAGLRIGHATPFRVELTAAAVRVHVGEREVLVLPKHGRDLRGSWGVAIGDGLVRLAGLTIAPLPKK